MDELTLHTVRGFDPMQYVYLLRDSQNNPLVNAATGKPQMRLATNALKTWFRLSFPTGRISVEPLPAPSNRIRVRSRVYSDYNLPETAYLGEGVAESMFVPGTSPDLMQSTANSAICAALFNAGFGCQVALFLKSDENEAESALCPDGDVPFSGPSASASTAETVQSPEDALRSFLETSSPAAATEPAPGSKEVQKRVRKTRGQPDGMGHVTDDPVTDVAVATPIVTEEPFVVETPVAAGLAQGIDPENHVPEEISEATLVSNAVFVVTDAASASLKLYNGSPLCDVPSTLIKTIARSEMLQSMVSGDTLASIMAAAANIA